MFKLHENPIVINEVSGLYKSSENTSDDLIEAYPIFDLFEYGEREMFIFINSTNFPILKVIYVQSNMPSSKSGYVYVISDSETQDYTEIDDFSFRSSRGENIKNVFAPLVFINYSIATDFNERCFQRYGDTVNSEVFQTPMLLSGNERFKKVFPKGCFYVDFPYNLPDSIKMTIDQWITKKHSLYPKEMDILRDRFQEFLDTYDCGPKILPREILYQRHKIEIPIL